MNDKADIFELARDNDNAVNERLAETDGKIAAMQYDGRIGYHAHIATGETDPEYLWRVALSQALDRTLLEMVYIDGGTAHEAASQLDRQLGDSLQPHARERLVSAFEDQLEALIDAQSQAAAEGQR